MDINRLLNAPHIVVTKIDTSMVDSNFLNTFMQSYNLSSKAIALIFDVNEQQVHNWLCGRTKIRGCYATMLLLLSRYPELLKEIYHIETEGE